jgi:hypothetical protein
MTTDLIGQRVAVKYLRDGPELQAVIRGVQLTGKPGDHFASLLLVLETDQGSLVTHQGGFITIVKPASPDLKIKDDMVVWVDKGKVLFEVRFEDDSGYRLTLPPSTAADLGSALKRNAVKANKEYTDGTP